MSCIAFAEVTQSETGNQVAQVIDISGTVRNADGQSVPKKSGQSSTSGLPVAEKAKAPDEVSLVDQASDPEPKKADGEGDSIRFSRSGGSAVRGTGNTVISEKELSPVVKRFNRFFGDRGIRIKVVDRVDGLPVAIHAEAAKQGFDPAEIRGVLHNGTVYVVRNQHGSVTDVEATLFHEVFAHAGFRQLLGRDITKRFNQLFSALGGKQKIIDRAAKHGHNLQAYWDSFEKAGYSTVDKHAMLVDELFAHMSQNQAGASFPQRALQLLKEFYGAIRQWLRDKGFADLAQYGDADIAHLLKQARESLGKPNQNTKAHFMRTPMFSRNDRQAPPSEGLSDSSVDNNGRQVPGIKAGHESIIDNDDIWAEYQEDDDTRPTLNKIASAITTFAKKNWKEFTKNGGLGALTLRQLVEVGEKVLPNAKRYMDSVEVMLTYRNGMMDESARLAMRWRDLGNTLKKQGVKDYKKWGGFLSHLMHDATIHAVDPSKDFELSEVVIPGGMDRVNGMDQSAAAMVEPMAVVATPENLRAIKKRIRKAVKMKDLDKRVLAYFRKAEREIAGALKRDKKREKQHDILSRRWANLPQAAKDVFIEARDQYVDRSNKVQQAIEAEIERAELSEGNKRSALNMIRMEFESARVQGIYFPLFRKGNYFVRGLKPKTGFVPKTFRPKRHVEERINRETGEVTTFTGSDTWATQEAAMNSARSRGDLVGLDLVAVAEGDGWVLQENAHEKHFMMFDSAHEME